MPGLPQEFKRLVRPHILPASFREDLEESLLQPKQFLADPDTAEAGRSPAAAPRCAGRRRGAVKARQRLRLGQQHRDGQGQQHGDDPGPGGCGLPERLLDCARGRRRVEHQRDGRRAALPALHAQTPHGMAALPQRQGREGTVGGRQVGRPGGAVAGRPGGRQRHGPDHCITREPARAQPAARGQHRLAGPRQRGAVGIGLVGQRQDLARLLRPVGNHQAVGQRAMAVQDDHEHEAQQDRSENDQLPQARPGTAAAPVGRGPEAVTLLGIGKNGRDNHWIGSNH